MTHTDTSYYVYVALDKEGFTTEVPPLICETDEECSLFEEAALRQEQRLERRRLERPVNLDDR